MLLGGVIIIRVLIVTTVNFTPFGGVSNVILNYYRAMEKSGIQIDFVVTKNIDETIRKEIEISGGRIYILNMRNNNPFKYIKELKNIMKKNQYDIIHAHGNSNTLFLEMYSAKRAEVDIRISHSHSTNTRYPVINLMLRHFFTRYYTHGIACSEEAGKWLFNDNKFNILKNGIDLDRYIFNKNIRKSTRKALNLDSNKLIGHIGNFSYAKNYDYLIDIFREIYNLDNSYRLLLIGDGKLRDKVEEKVKNLNLSSVVMFLGKTDKVSEYLQAIDIIIMPSRFEGLPLSLIEAQAAGIPCYISSEISDEVKITKLINFVSIDEEPYYWANKIVKNKEYHREQNAEYARERIVYSGFSINHNANYLNELYRGYFSEV